jgi:hypothetical protein
VYLLWGEVILRRLDIPPEREAVEKVDAKGFLPTLKFVEENRGAMSFSPRFSIHRKAVLEKMSPNSYYIVMECNLSWVSSFISKISPKLGRDSRLWLEPLVSEGYRVRLFSPRPESDELVSVFPLVREAEKTGSCSVVRVIRPLIDLREYPEDRRAVGLDEDPIVFLPSSFFAECIERLDPAFLARSFLYSTGASNIEDIIRAFEDTGLARVSMLLSTKFNVEPVGAVARLLVSEKVEGIGKTAAILFAHILKTYFLEKYGVETDFKTNVVDTGVVEVFVYRTDRLLPDVQKIISSGEEAEK